MPLGDFGELFFAQYVFSTIELCLEKSIKHLHRKINTLLLNKTPHCCQAQKTSTPLKLPTHLFPNQCLILLTKLPVRHTISLIDIGHLRYAFC